MLVMGSFSPNPDSRRLMVSFFYILDATQSCAIETRVKIDCFFPIFDESTYDPHSSVLDKIIFLKITTKFIYNISKILNNQMKITTPSIIFKKKIPKIFSIIMRNEGWKLKKEWKIQATLSPFIPHPPLNLAMHHKNAWNFLWWYFLPKTRLLTKKIVQKSIYTGSGALALILAFVAVSKS